jgi:bifunctional DNA-binding transcriptional regulator/antitoxin component of YhaV-PrlF toxin-antitoxin module
LDEEVEMDTKGRVLIPAKIRHGLRARRFRAKLVQSRIVLEPIGMAESVKGKYEGLLKVGREELEEKQEKFLKGR